MAAPEDIPDDPAPRPIAPEKTVPVSSSIERSVEHEALRRRSADEAE